MQRSRFVCFFFVIGLFTFAACQPVRREAAQPILIEHKIPTYSAHAGGITVGADGAIWFAETGANQIGRITTDGVITEYPIPTEDGMDDTQGFVGLGPDGAIWFNEDRVHKLGRITPDGTITEFDLPKEIGVIRQIVAGPDGALWVTAVEANKIVKLSTAGQVLAQYTLPQADSRPAGMVVGPDGAFWFVEVGANQIGRISVDGVITEYAIPTANSFPIRLTVGPDHALWFNMFGADKIGRITLEGQISEYDTPGMGPLSLAAGADGAIWFTGYKSTEIGRMTTDGVLTKLEIPTYAAVPYHIVAGPDGNLWFTEQQGNKVGQIRLPPTTPITQAANSKAFATARFKLPLNVALPPEWGVFEEYTDLVTFQNQSDGWQLAFNLVTQAEVTDPVDPKGKRVAFPADFVAWLQANPDFTTGEPTAVTVAGYPGIQIDATPIWRSTTAHTKPFLHLPSKIGWNLVTDPEQWRFILLDDVNGERVLILMITPPHVFDQATQEAQALLTTVAIAPLR